MLALTATNITSCNCFLLKSVGLHFCVEAQLTKAPSFNLAKEQERFLLQLAPAALEQRRLSTPTIICGKTIACHVHTIHEHALKHTNLCHPPRSQKTCRPLLLTDIFYINHTMTHK
jgi:hypothetical protein